MRVLYYFLITIMLIPLVVAGVIIDIPEDVSTVNVLTGNLTQFIQLTDTPSTYAGNGSNCVLVKDGGNGLVFATCPGGAAVNPFDQVLNTTSNVTFVNVSLTGSLNVTGNATFNQDVIILGTLLGGSPVKVDGGLNVTGTVGVEGTLVADLIKGAFNWIIGPTSTQWLIFNTTQLDFNETLLNQTIDIKISANATSRWTETGDTLHPTNSSKNVGIGTTNAVDKLSLFGNFNQTGGNSTIDLIYGGMFNRDPAATTITLSGVNDFENITNLSAGNLNGVSFTNNTLTVLFDGVYRIDYSISATSAANSRYALAVAIDNSVDNESLSERTINAGGNLGNTGGTANLALTSGATINLQVSDLNAPAQDISYVSVNVNVIRIGN